MIIRGHYVGLPVAELLEIRKELLLSLSEARKGSRFAEVDMGGKSGKKSLLSYQEIVHELKEVLFALKKAEPDVYGSPVKKLIPNFNKNHYGKVHVPFVVVKGIGRVTGNLIKDGKFEYVDETSLITFTRGYYKHWDGQGYIAKNGNGVWQLFGIAGYMYDFQSNLSESPLSTSLPWDKIEVTL